MNLCLPRIVNAPGARSWSSCPWSICSWSIISDWNLTEDNRFHQLIKVASSWSTAYQVEIRKIIPITPADKFIEGAKCVIKSPPPKKRKQIWYRCLGVLLVTRQVKGIIFFLMGRGTVQLSPLGQNPSPSLSPPEMIYFAQESMESRHFESRRVCPPPQRPPLPCHPLILKSLAIYR